MEDTGQDTTIRIGVDGTGVSEGVTSIKRSLADLGMQAHKLFKNTVVCVKIGEPVKLLQSDTGSNHH